LLEIYTFYVYPFTIETRFYRDSKPEEITERLLKGPKVTGLSPSMLGMAYCVPTARTDTEILAGKSEGGAIGRRGSEASNKNALYKQLFALQV